MAKAPFAPLLLLSPPNPLRWASAGAPDHKNPGLYECTVRDGTIKSFRGTTRVAPPARGLSRALVTWGGRTALHPGGVRTIGSEVLRQLVFPGRAFSRWPAFSVGRREGRSSSMPFGYSFDGTIVLPFFPDVNRKLSKVTVALGGEICYNTQRKQTQEV